MYIYHSYSYHLYTSLTHTYTHICTVGGVRHMIWDKAPEDLINTEKVEQSSYILIGFSTLIAVGLALV